MNDLETLAELRRKAEAATPGPWETTSVSIGTESTPDAVLGVVASSGNVLWDPQEMGEEDKAFIAAANPAVVLALLNEVAALHDRTATLKERLRDFAPEDGKHCVGCDGGDR